MNLFVAGVVLGFFSCIGSEILAVAVTCHMIDRKHEPPTKEEWNMQRDCMWG